MERLPCIDLLVLTEAQRGPRAGQGHRAEQREESEPRASCSSGLCSVHCAEQFSVTRTFQGGCRMAGSGLHSLVASSLLSSYLFSAALFGSALDVAVSPSCPVRLLLQAQSLPIGMRPCLAGAFRGPLGPGGQAWTSTLGTVPSWVEPGLLLLLPSRVGFQWEAGAACDSTLLFPRTAAPRLPHPGSHVEHTCTNPVPERGLTQCPTPAPWSSCHPLP